MDSLADRFDSKRYEGICRFVRVRNAVQWLYGKHVLPNDLVERLVNLGRAYELPVIEEFDPDRCSIEIRKDEADQLRHELEFVRRVVNDPLLDPHLAKLIELLQTVLDLPSNLEPCLILGTTDPIEEDA